ncbi:MAG: NUDIX hydrolase [Oscillochloridaceae bacterium]|nr:NUDIX hydrolase [Chloroflexaceae bacterium]MDW8389206.1 NUDIX hydrolase [Oscillochloridaceae bacterium]
MNAHNPSPDAPAWERGETIVTIESPWVRLIAERWRDDQGRLLDYWRVERAHSVIVAPIQTGRLLLPRPQFRPGLGRPTLDLPGGRLPAGQTPLTAATAILVRELGLPAGAITTMRPLNRQGWAINSSFSDQLLYGVVASIDPARAPTLPHETLSFDRAGLRALLERLECLQCRVVVLELLAEMD